MADWCERCKKPVCTGCGYCHHGQEIGDILDCYEHLADLARRVAEMSGGPYALEALLDLREWFGMEREVAVASAPNIQTGNCPEHGHVKVIVNEVPGQPRHLQCTRCGRECWR